MTTIPKIAFITAWLSTLPCDGRSQSNISRKRKRQYKPISPSSSPPFSTDDQERQARPDQAQEGQGTAIIPSPPITMNPDAQSEMPPESPATPAKTRRRDNDKDKGGLDGQLDPDATPHGDSDIARPPAPALPSFPHPHRPRYHAPPPPSESSLPSRSAETTSSPVFIIEARLCLPTQAYAQACYCRRWH